MQIVLGHAAVDAALAVVAAAVAELDDVRRSATRQVDVLLDGGWQGAAAASFGEAWEEWLAGADEVRLALAGLHDALAATRRGLVAADTAGASALGRLIDRLDA